MSGFLSALSGVGAGMSEYGRMLGDQRNMDWQTQRDNVAYERQMSLENLRARRNKESEQMRIDATASEGALNRQATLDAENAKMAHEEKMVGVRNDAALNTAKETEDYKYSKSLERREQEATALRESEAYAQLSPKEQRLAEFSVLHPEVAGVLAKVSAKDQAKFPYEHYAKSYRDGYTQWDSLDDNTKKQWLNKAAEVNITDSDEVRSLYAESFAKKSIRYTEVIDSMTPEDSGGTATEADYRKLAALKGSGDQRAIALYESMTPEDQALVDSMIEPEPTPMSGGAKRKGRGGAARTGDSALNFLGRIGEDRARQKEYLQSLK